MKLGYIAFLASLFLFVNSTYSSAVTGVSLSKSSAKDCETIVVSLNGTHYCPNDAITNISHVVSGTDITITLTISFGFCIPPTILPVFSTTYSLPLTGISPGSYTVKTVYHTTAGPSTSLAVTPCCLAEAEAGNDTMFCDISSFQLNGNSPPAGATASWSVVKGNGSISNNTIPNATWTNLSFGENKAVWTMVDSICTTRDTVLLVNSEKPSPAIVENDRNICKKTAVIKATPLTAGTGKWWSLTAGSGVTNPTSANANIFVTNPGSYQFEWRVTNGICNENSDTLTITYVNYIDTPSITFANSILTSSVAPQYKWYLNGSEIAGATNKTHKPVINGLYRVLTGEVGCESGLFSNEIEVLTVGIGKSENDVDLKISPNPSNGIVRISGLTEPVEILIYNMNMQEVMRTSTSKSSVELDCNELGQGLFFVRATSDSTSGLKRLVLTK